jgi:hypothetical protein
MIRRTHQHAASARRDGAEQQDLPGVVILELDDS